ncbi:MAG: hypothetical protein ACOX52_17475 [Verrucomicrobiota bacterium]
MNSVPSVAKASEKACCFMRRLRAMVADPELASPLTFSDILELCLETYTYTAKRYTYTYTMMRRVRVRVGVRRVADPSDHCLNRNRNRDRNRNRNRDRDRFLPWLASCPHGLLKLRCRVAGLLTPWAVLSIGGS